MTGHDLGSFAPYMLNRIMARYNLGVAETLEPEGISVPQMRVLIALAGNGPRTVNELSVLTVINQSTLSRSLDSMEAADLIRRETCEQDSRFRRIHLTASGEALYSRVWPVMREAEDRLFADISAEERAAFTTTLGRILKSVRKNDF
ncbi:DNA-binding MarR family transcriptional regulator [Pseudorhodobacter sp. 4114]|nr:DNA-binding MarR family transcriptional regulator [Pseudorhodobacter sp. 4114]